MLDHYCTMQTQSVVLGGIGSIGDPETVTSAAMPPADPGYLFHIAVGQDTDNNSRNAV